MSLRLANKNVKFKPTRKPPPTPSTAAGLSLPGTPQISGRDVSAIPEDAGGEATAPERANGESVVQPPILSALEPTVARQQTAPKLGESRKGPIAEARGPIVKAPLSQNSINSLGLAVNPTKTPTIDIPGSSDESEVDRPTRPAITNPPPRIVSAQMTTSQSLNRLLSPPSPVKALPTQEELSPNGQPTAETSNTALPSPEPVSSPVLPIRFTAPTPSARSKQPESTRKELKSLKFTPQRKLGSQRSAAERKRLAFDSDDSGFEEETSRPNRPAAKTNQSKAKSTAAAPKPRKRQRVSTPEEDGDEIPVASASIAPNAHDAPLEDVEQASTTIDPRRARAERNMAKAKRVTKPKEKPATKTPRKKRKNPESDDYDDDAEILIDPITMTVIPKPPKPPKPPKETPAKRARKLKKKAAPQTADHSGSEATALAVIPHSEELGPINPEEATMAQMCKDSGRGRPSSRFEAIMEAKATEKKRRREARARMKRLAREGREQISDEEENADNSALVPLPGPSEVARVAENVAEEEEEANQPEADTQVARNEEMSFAESNLVARGRLVNGRIVLDEESLVVDRVFDDDMGDVIDSQPSDRKINSATYGKREPVQRWSKAETELFFDAIRKNGSDLTIIACYFPNRNRRQIRAKWRKEEKLNPELIDAAMFNKEGRGGMEAFSEMVGLDLVGPCPEDPLEIYLASQKLETQTPGPEDFGIPPATAPPSAGKRAPPKKTSAVRLPKQYAITNGANGVVSEVIEEE